MGKYLERINTLDTDIVHKELHTLYGEDVISILEEKGLLENLTNEQVEEIIEYVGRKLEIPWTSYIEAVLDTIFIRG